MLIYLHTEIPSTFVAHVDSGLGPKLYAFLLLNVLFAVILVYKKALSRG